MGDDSEQCDPRLTTLSITSYSNETVNENSPVTAAWIQEQIQALHTSAQLSKLFRQKIKNLYIKYNISVMLWTVLTLGLLPAYYAEYREEMTATETPSLPAPADTERRSWKDVARDMMKVWALVCKGGLVLCPMSLTLLQFGGMKSTLARTLTIAACICAGGAFILSAIFISMRSKLSRGSIGNLWVEASPTLSSPGALTFWVTLVSPMSYMIWSLLYCVLTLLVISWNKYVGGGTTPDIGNSTDAKPAFIGPLSRFAEPLLSSEGGNAAREATGATPHRARGYPRARAFESEALLSTGWYAIPKPICLGIRRELTRSENIHKEEEVDRSKDMVLNATKSITVCSSLTVARVYPSD
ncbi:hypothetical protein BDZ97DRAFT_1752691 [Flammula alnicola]|nr:hypothetical protein BDZ97DRAFT_1752691 [Flammula alnicola]